MTQDEWRETVTNRLDKLEGKVNQLQTSTAVEAVHRENVEKRLSAIENSSQWIIRLIIGAIVLAILSFMISGGFFVV